MPQLFFFCVLYLFGFFILYHCHNLKISAKISFFLELLVIFLSCYLHLFLAVLTPNGDSVFFVSIMTRLTEEPFFGFYDRTGITYPPLFNYTYFLLGKLLQLLHIPFDWRFRSFIFCIKLPGICCEFLMSFFIYRTAKKYVPEKKRILPLYLILLNPGYLLVTSYISQVDALYSFFVLLTLYLIVNHRLKTACFTFAAGILFKFQALFIGPVLLLAIIEQIILHNFSLRRFFSHLFAGLSAIACIVLSYLPFLYDFHTGISTQTGLTHNFTSSVKGYGRASANAYNFWTLLGYNLRYDSEYFGPFPCRIWGILFIVCLVILCGVFFFLATRVQRKSPVPQSLSTKPARFFRPFDSSLYPLLAAFLISGIFCFSMRMMARYLYPAIVLLVYAYALKPTKKRLGCAVSFSMAFFLNVWCDFMIYPYAAYRRELVLPYLVSFYTIGCFAWLVYTIISEIKDLQKNTVQER